MGVSTQPTGVAGQPAATADSGLDHPAIAAAVRLATELLEPAAPEVDRTSVPRSHLDALAAAGLLGLHGPGSVGRAAVPLPAARAVEKILAGADPATWLVQAQHQTPVALLGAADGPVRRWLQPLATGELIAGGIAARHAFRALYSTAAGLAAVVSAAGVGARLGSARGS